jgi:hypothetical protein
VNELGDEYYLTSQNHDQRIEAIVICKSKIKASNEKGISKMLRYKKTLPNVGPRQGGEFPVYPQPSKHDFI